MILSIQPLVAAISAGCCCVVKVSEVAPHYGQLLADLVPKYLDTSAYQVVQGAVEEITTLLEMQCGIFVPFTYRLTDPHSIGDHSVFYTLP